MRCPCCQKDLVITHSSFYETIDEHVGGGFVSSKPGYQCLNPWCICHCFQAVWTADGDFFVDPPDEVPSTVASKVIEKCSISGMNYALDTWNHEYHSMVKLRERGRRSFQVGKYKVNIFPVFSSDEKGKYKRRKLKFSLEFWKKSGDGCYTGIVPLHRMVLHVLGKFRREMRLLEKKPHPSTVKTCLYMVEGKDFLGNKDSRLFVKVSAIMIRLFYPLKVQKLKQLQQ